MKKIFIPIVFIVTVISFALAVGFAGMAGEERFKNFAQEVSRKYSNGAELKERTVSETFAAGKLREVRIEAIATDVVFLPSKDGQVHLTYTYKKADADKTREQLRSEIALIGGDILTFRLGERTSEEKNIRLNLANLLNMGLTVDDARAEIRLPASIPRVRIANVSGDVRLDGLKLDQLRIVSVSGDVEFKEGESREVEHQSVSGDLKLHGRFPEVKARTVSGDFKLESLLDAPVVNFDTTSGDAELHFAKGVMPNLVVDFETTSGEIHVRGDSRAESDGALKGYRLGDGRGHVVMESVSGDLRVK